MREDFLYHLWKFRKFNTEDLKTSDGEIITILHPGFQNELSGPDFFNAKIQIGDQLWAGNVEMHLKSSDWYAHLHETDPAYDNVILHVVWEHDVEIYRKNETVIPSLVLKDKVADAVLQSYNDLLETSHLKINCEKHFGEFPDFQMEHWLERLFFERLEKKSGLILDLLSKTGNNWEAVLFVLFARSFGSKVNGDSFMNMALSLDFKIVQKLASNQFALEALFLGQAGLIRNTDKYGKALEEEYAFLKHKFSLENEFIASPQFFRLRPDNFPNIRLAQLAAYYSENKNVFQQLINAKEANSIRDLFKIRISEYWQSHYNFGKIHAQKDKKLSADFVDLIIINCIVPLNHCYFQHVSKQDESSVQNIISEVRSEKNSIIKLFNGLRPKTATSAMHSQALVQLKNNYCDLNKCLQCELGASLLRKSPKYI